VNTDVCVIGSGACTSIGADLWSSAAAVRAGLTGFAEHPYMVDRAGEPMVVARAPYIDVDTPLTTRMVFLAARAACHACIQAFGENSSGVWFPLLIGIPSDVPGLAQALAANFRKPIGAAHIRSVDTVAAGHSAALIALEIAVDRIKSGSADWFLVGGVESYIDPERLERLDETGQLHAPSNAWGFIPGEGAAFCVITTVRNAVRWGIQPRERIVSVASARESNLIRTGSVCVGIGLSAAIRNVLFALPSEAQVDTVVCDMNGDAYRADEYGFTVARMGEHFRDSTDVTTPADCWGDVGAASGLLFLALVLAVARKGYIKGPHALVWTSSDTGERAAVLLHSNYRSESADSWA
jgi:3-oxoacyl-[acyl-carrier-protein] synthase-1